MKYLKFYKCRDGHYIVTDRKDIGLACLEKKGQIFKKRAIMCASSEDTEWTSECLRQVADKLDEMEKRCKK